MNTKAIEKITLALIGGVPKLVSAIKAGRDLNDIKLGEFISSDALEQVRAANRRVDDFIENG